MVPPSPPPRAYLAYPLTAQIARQPTLHNQTLLLPSSPPNSPSLENGTPRGLWDGMALLGAGEGGVGWVENNRRMFIFLKTRIEIKISDLYYVNQYGFFTLRESEA